MTNRAVVVGSSVAGIRAARALRTSGFVGDVVVVGEEPELPYDKPPLSKGYLTGAHDSSHLRLLNDAQASKDGIELRLGRTCTGLEVEQRRVTIDGEEPISFDHLIVATGARPRAGPWPTEGIHVLRTLSHARALAADLRQGGKVVVIGAGFIGAEVASSARALGLDVVVVDAAARPMEQIVGTEVAQRLTDLHRRHGTTTHFGVGVDSVERRTGLFEVQLTNGAVVKGSTVVVGIGAVANDAWLAASGLQTDDGLWCDHYGQVLGTASIYAVGDVARVFDPVSQDYIRHEHWTSAVTQATCVGHNICHPDDPRAVDPLEYVWSDQYGSKIQIVGKPGQASEAVIIDHPNHKGAFAALCVDPDGALRGAATLDWPRACLECRRMVLEGRPPARAVERLRSLSASAA